MRYMTRFIASALLVCTASFASLAWAETIDLNTATTVQLQTLPGIGPKKAEAILQYRKEHGPFTSVDQLREVHGIGEKMLAQLRSQVTVGSANPSTSGAPATPPAASVPSVPSAPATPPPAKTPLPTPPPAK